jgi:hypothetical protein
MKRPTKVYSLRTKQSLANLVAIAKPRKYAAVALAGLEFPVQDKDWYAKCRSKVEIEHSPERTHITLFSSSA